MTARDNNSESTLNQDASSQIDEALNDIRKAIASENNATEEILELTEIVGEDTQPTLSAKAPKKSQSNNLEDLKASFPIPKEEDSNDILKRIDESVAAKQLKDSSLTKDMIQDNSEKPGSASVEKYSDNVIHNEDTNYFKEEVHAEDLYIADEVAKQSQDLFRTFIKATSKQHGEHSDNMMFRSGTTLEDLVVEMLKPELSTWLNKNLPNIVQSVVEKEIKKLIPQDE